MPISRLDSKYECMKSVLLKRLRSLMENICWSPINWLRNWWEVLNYGESPDNWLGFQDDMSRWEYIVMIQWMIRLQKMSFDLYNCYSYRWNWWPQDLDIFARLSTWVRLDHRIRSLLPSGPLVVKCELSFVPVQSN